MTDSIGEIKYFSSLIAALGAPTFVGPKLPTALSLKSKKPESLRKGPFNNMKHKTNVRIVYLFSRYAFYQAVNTEQPYSRRT